MNDAPHRLNFYGKREIAHTTGNRKTPTLINVSSHLKRKWWLESLTVFSKHDCALQIARRRQWSRVQKDV